MTPPQPTLHTERLTLVPLADEHLALQRELAADPEVMRYLVAETPSPEELARTHRRRLTAAEQYPGLGYWVGVADGEPVGWWLLRPNEELDRPAEPGEAELGYRLLRRFWRRGYGSEGSRELVRYGFADHGLDRIFAHTMAINDASRATMSAVGLTFVRAFPCPDEPGGPIPGSEHGEVEYALTRTAWRAQHKP